MATFTHPNIVQVYEVGQHNQLPFMALEFVSGGSLEDKLKNGPLSPTEAAELVEQIAHGMNAAHQAGIVHRDLKPANVLITEDGVPKVTDFGLAKKVEGGSGLTVTGAIMGTPSYMAPEQASGEGKRVGPAAYVYALGAVLYKCLTGRPPFQASSPLDTILQVVSEDPKPPSQVNPNVPRDLETICLKCLEKTPFKRYSSAEAFAGDLHRYLNDELITARPVGQGERVVKWVKRHKSLAGAFVVVVLVLVLGAIISGWQAVRATAAEAKALEKGRVAVANEKKARDEKEEADKQRALAEKQKQQVERIAEQLQAKSVALKAELQRSDRLKKQAMKQLDLAQQAVYTSNLLRAAQVYHQEPAKARGYLHDYRFVPIHRRCAAWRFYERQCTKRWKATLLEHADSVPCVCYSPDGKTLASASWDKTVKLWDVQTGKVKATLKGHQHRVGCVSFSPDGKILASGSIDGARLWNVDVVLARDAADQRATAKNKAKHE